MLIQYVLRDDFNEQQQILTLNFNSNLLFNRSSKENQFEEIALSDEPIMKIEEREMR